ncbi:MAG: hypothetical protein KatS3mg032_1018 [Cyclobacteriaceae bacterium]|nr:MAG: hypothetical protein KatS3mg032_1018 [Cyclobacteriaceae bacterium]
MADRIKILIVENSVGFTGAFRSITTLVSHLPDSVEIHFALPSQSTVIQKVKGPVLLVPFVELRRSLRSVVAYVPMLLINALRIIRYCRQHNIQIIHVNDLYNLCGVVIKWLHPKYAVVYHVRLLPDSYGRKLYGLWKKLISRYADRIICVSQAVQQAACFPEQKTTVIYNALPAHSPVKSARKNTDSVTFIYLANYIPGKGHDDAIEAFRIVNEKYPNCQLLMAGSDMGLSRNKQYRQQLEGRIQQYGLSGKIILNDFVDEAMSFLQSGDVFLNFSRSESFSMTILEAMQVGLPVIATRSGGPAELVEHEKTGLLVPTGNITAMGEAMCKLAASGNLLRAMGEAGQNRARTVFSIEISAARLAKIYQRLTH